MQARERTTGYALRNRGLITVDRRGGRWVPAVTDAGRFYLEHDRHPDRPAPENGADPEPVDAVPSEAPRAARSSGAAPAVPKSSAVKLAEAKALVARLVEEREIVIQGATDNVVKDWRRVIEYAKRHDLVPEGRHIETRRMWQPAGVFCISLVKGGIPKRTPDAELDLRPVPVPQQLRSPHPVVASLRDDEGRLVMPAAVRRRALLILQAFAAEAERRGYQVRERPVADRHRRRGYSYDGRYHPPSYSRREGEFDVMVDEFTYTVTVEQETPNSADPEKAARLLLKAANWQWNDRKTWMVEDQLPKAMAQLPERAAEDRRRALEKERAEAEQRARWEAAMAAAREQAVQEQFAKELRRQAKLWREARDLDAYCDALEHRLGTERALGGSGELAAARKWLEWARAHARALNPLTGLPAMPKPRKVESKDLEPYLDGFSAYGPNASGLRWR